MIWKVEDVMKVIDYVQKQPVYDICREQLGMWMQRFHALGIAPFQDHYFPSFASALTKSKVHKVPLDESVFSRRKESF